MPKRLLLIASVLLSILLLAGIALFQISKLRTFQFFGGLTARVNTAEKVIALTFDDAPTEYTEEVLKVLDEKKVRATFFVIGQELGKYPDVGKKMVLAGHEIGNHSYSHQRFLLKSQGFIDSEVQNTNSLIRKTGYTGEILFRPPNGKKLLGLPWYLQQHGIKTIMWDVEPDTYATPDPVNGQLNPEFIRNYTVEHTKPGSIILLHPFCKSCLGDRIALPQIIDTLQAQGYRFVTLSELLKYEVK